MQYKQLLLVDFHHLDLGKQGRVQSGEPSYPKEPLQKKSRLSVPMEDNGNTYFLHISAFLRFATSYCIAGNFGEVFNLANRQFCRKSPKFFYALLN